MATDDSILDDIQKSTAGIAMAFGAAGLLAPGALSKAYGLSDISPDYRYLARMWGTRTAVIGVLSATATGEARRVAFGASAAMNAADAFVVLTTKDLPARTRLMAAMTSASLAGVTGYACAHS